MGVILHSQRWMSRLLPCFRFLVEDQVDDWKPDATSVDYFSSVTVDLISEELANCINFVICRKKTVSGWEGIIDEFSLVEAMSRT